MPLKFVDVLMNAEKTIRSCETNKLPQDSTSKTEILPDFDSDSDDDEITIDTLERFGLTQYLISTTYLLDVCLNTLSIYSDCHVFNGLWSYVTSVAGGTMTAARLLVENRADIALHFDGGRHHAHRYFIYSPMTINNNSYNLI
jgi:acetoin utilization deacetylase AcuC-like enzyme